MPRYCKTELEQLKTVYHTLQKMSISASNTPKWKREDCKAFPFGGISVIFGVYLEV